MIAALYLRSAVSDDDAIAEQRRLCTEHAKAKGWHVGEVFIDNGVSGLLDDRPGLDALRDCLREGRASVVIAEDVAQLFRDIDKLAAFNGWCKAQEISISYALRGSINEDSMNRLFQNGMAERRRGAAGRASI